MDISTTYTPDNFRRVVTTRISGVLELRYTPRDYVPPPELVDTCFYMMRRFLGDKYGDLNF